MSHTHPCGSIMCKESACLADEARRRALPCTCPQVSAFYQGHSDMVGAYEQVSRCLRHGGYSKGGAE